MLRTVSGEVLAIRTDECVRYSHQMPDDEILLLPTTFAALPVNIETPNNTVAPTIITMAYAKTEDGTYAWRNKLISIPTLTMVCDILHDEEAVCNRWVYFHLCHANCMMDELTHYNPNHHLNN